MAAHAAHHYVFFNRDRERISEPVFLGTKAFAGAQLKYTWRELEPEKDAYDFSAIAKDLKMARNTRIMSVQKRNYGPSSKRLKRWCYGKTSRLFLGKLLEIFLDAATVSGREAGRINVGHFDLLLFFRELRFHFDGEFLEFVH